MRNPEQAAGLVAAIVASDRAIWTAKRRRKLLLTVAKHLNRPVHLEATMRGVVTSWDAQQSAPFTDGMQDGPWDVKFALHLVEVTHVPPDVHRILASGNVTVTIGAEVEP